MAEKLTERQKHILYFVLETNDEVGMDELVRRLQVSRRTIQRDMSAIQSYLDPFGLAILVGPKSLSLHGKPTDIGRMKREIGKLPSKLAMTPKDRELHVAMDLLMEQGPSKLEYFGRQLHVTTASLSQNLDDVADWFNAHGLELIRRRGYGVEVQGNEETRREAIVELVYDQLALPDLMGLLRQDEEQVVGSPLSSWFSKWFGEEQIAQVRVILTGELEQSNPPLDEAAFYGFMLHVLLSVKRIKSGASLPNSDGIEAAESQDTQICIRILRRLVPDDEAFLGEARYLAKHLRGAKVLMTEENRILPLHITSMDLAYRMVKHLTKTLDIPLIEDRNLILSMAQHLEPAIHRMTTGLLIRNPLLQEIERQYPVLFHAMRLASNQVLLPFGLQVPDSEIGYLTMHLGASYERRRAQRIWRARIVCPNGISSAELLASRFQKEFPQIQIVSLGAFSDQQEVDFDLIVSTVPFEERDVPVVTVSPFLTQEERNRVQKLLEQLESKGLPRRDRKPEAILLSEEQTLSEADYISQRARIREISASSIRGVIDLLVDDIVSTGEARNRDALTQAILQREQLGSIVLPGKRLSVLHTRTSALSRCQVLVYRLREPFAVAGVAQTKEMIDTVLVLLASDNEPLTTIRLLGKLSSALVMDEEMVDTLRHAPISVVQHRIRQAMYQTEE